MHWLLLWGNKQEQINVNVFVYFIRSFTSIWAEMLSELVFKSVLNYKYTNSKQYLSMYLIHYTMYGSQQINRAMQTTVIRMYINFWLFTYIFIMYSQAH